MQPSIPFNPPAAIGICFGDSTRAACFRRRAVAVEFRRPACKMHMWGGRGNRGRGWKERGGSIGPFDRSGNSSTTQFALHRMTSLGFLVAIHELDTYPPQYGSSRATHLACLPRNRFSIFSRLVLRLLPHLSVTQPERDVRNFSKILHARSFDVLEEGGKVVPLAMSLLRLSRPLSRFNLSPRLPHVMFIQCELVHDSFEEFSKIVRR